MCFILNCYEFLVDGLVCVDDFYIDFFYIGFFFVGDCEWWLILIGGLCEGGNSYYVFDVMQFDLLMIVNGEEVLMSFNYVLSCIIGSYNSSMCGFSCYGCMFWEYIDSDFGMIWL